MRGRVQAVSALALAISLHLGAFALRPAAVGAMSSRAGGADLVSLQAADASIAAMVDAWDRPPEVVTVPDAPPPQPVQTTALPDLRALPDPPLNLPEPAKKAKPPAKTTAKAAKAKQASELQAGRTAQRASGTGNGTQAGAGGTAAAATLSKATVNNLRASWGASIRSRIERRKTYPSTARGASGTVTVRLSVSHAGQLLGVSVAKSSGNAALDQAALNAVTAAKSFRRRPRA